MLTTETVLEESENSKPRICGGSRRKLTTVLDKLQSRVPNVDTTKNKSGMTEETKRKK